MSETEKAEGVKPHFLFMRFHGLLLVVPEQCVCVRQAIHLRPTHTHTHVHIVLSRQRIAAHTGKGKQEHA